MNNLAQQEIRQILNYPIDWDKIIEISVQHELLSFLYYNLNRLELQNIIPQKILTTMKNYYYINLHKNLLFEKEIFNIFKITDREKIDAVPLKGFSLIYILYHNAALRVMADIDILVRQNQRQKICDILTVLGYTETEHLTFLKMLPSNRHLIIEVHTKIAPARPYEINLPSLWERLRANNINNQRIFFLSKEDTFLSLALHIRRHTRRLTLKFIIDIVELLNANKTAFDWNYIKKSAKDNRIITTVYLSLYITKELLDADISYKIMNEFQPDIIKSALIHTIINKYNFFIFMKLRGIFLRLLLFDTFKDFAVYLFRVSLLERRLGRL